MVYFLEPFLAEGRNLFAAFEVAWAVRGRTLVLQDMAYQASLVVAFSSEHVVASGQLTVDDEYLYAGPNQHK
jgi:hypothetical protein